jgi:hypothetical protein
MIAKSALDYFTQRFFKAGLLMVLSLAILQIIF